jgi:plastocyanin
MQTTRPLALALSLLAGACGRGDAPPATPAQAPASAPAAAGPAALGERVAPSGRVIEVKMVTDERGNLFEPEVVTAKRGDTVRFVLESGVHNVHFPADRNAGTQVPPASALLQAPGQTYEVVVGAGPGTYPFQCDPHVALGMVGTLTVE